MSEQIIPSCIKKLENKPSKVLVALTKHLSGKGNQPAHPAVRGPRCVLPGEPTRFCLPLPPEPPEPHPMDHGGLCFVSAEGPVEVDLFFVSQHGPRAWSSAQGSCSQGFWSACVCVCMLSLHTQALSCGLGETVPLDCPHVLCHVQESVGQHYHCPRCVSISPAPGTHPLHK